MSALTTLLLVLVAPFSYGRSDQLYSCSSLRSEGSIVTKQDTTLKGHVRQSLAKVSFIQCGLRCQRHQWCISINFQITTGQCELNDYGVKDETSAEGEEFEKRQGFVYSQLRPQKFGCHASICRNGGSCNVDCLATHLTRGHTCACTAGYTGINCEKNIDECSSNPCQNGGSCLDQINGYNCTCVAGYTGVNCETNINECSSNPCQNDGTCKDDLNSYTCACLAGFNGVNCEKNIDECSSSPCQNGGSCSDQVNAYNCVCVAGYTGANCEKDIDECSSNPCQNGGSCLDQVNGYNCTCLVGFTGTNCETNIDDCSSNPCQNGGSCLDQVNGYKCTCVSGFIGENCENIDECASSPCQNNATCSDQANSYKCICVAGFTGTNCETNINECASNPCQYDGTCTDQVNGYKCSCVAGLTGKNCEANINECYSFPCKNGGTCSDRVSGYICSCKPGYTGTNCEIKNCELFWPSADINSSISKQILSSSNNLQEFTISVWLNVPANDEVILYPFSYATSSMTSALSLAIRTDGIAEITIQNETWSVQSGFKRDNTWQHCAITWASDNGKVFFYHNGIQNSSDVELNQGGFIASGGTLIVGQYQGSDRGVFKPVKRLMVGYMADLNIWSRAFNATVIKSHSSMCFSFSSFKDGVMSWTDILGLELKGSIVKSCPSSCPS